MKILVVGSGGREHALIWAISASPLCDALYCAPGNAGIARHATCIPIAADDVDRLVDFAAEEGIDFVVVGPEAPLVLGLVDKLEARGIAAFGPGAAAAQLEGSKGFMKDLCVRAGVATAAYRRFTDAASAADYIRERGSPVVVKADGLAAGKGVVVANSTAEAMQAVDDMMVGRVFGPAGGAVVIEDRLVGEEVSFIALVDGKTALPLASSQDHKPVGDGDTGPNTGGMGAYSPAPVVTEALEAEIMAKVVEPLVATMAEMGHPFQGVLYAGLMITEDGPQLLEVNTRFGDPECQPLMMRLRSDLLPALIAARDGELKGFDLRWRDEAALCVVMASAGYPGSYEKGTEIKGLEKLDGLEDVVVFHAGTEMRDGKTHAIGGRVLGITALGKDVAAAQARAYAAVDMIDWPEGFCRRDIGWRAIARDA
ncbi:MAG: phosphoribosylamine--glycine ligase [Proteobacteria bacterium]|nr:phosphoribosylamine--glycine ligase [Pseudomonadota bacterium]